ncbi:MAG: OmpA family protein [Pseudomonadota bacterium]
MNAQPRSLAALAIVAALAAPAGAVWAQSSGGVVDLGAGVPSLDELRSALGSERQIVFDDATTAPTSRTASTRATARDGGAVSALPRVSAAAEPVAAPSAGAPSRSAQGAVSIPIQFTLNSAAIAPAFRPHIARIAEYLRSEPGARLQIVGHADAQGESGFNQTLSERRAESVRAALVLDHGIERGRLSAEGRGESQPLYGDAYDGRNRRVEFRRVR